MVRNCVACTKNAKCIDPNHREQQLDRKNLSSVFPIESMVPRCLLMLTDFQLELFRMIRPWLPGTDLVGLIVRSNVRLSLLPLQS